jgi:carbon-monoxide dehydrogenase large subunit
MATMKFGIGQAITRREDDRLLTGQGRFVDDIRLPNALHAMFVRSPYAHAAVGAIDTAEAAESRESSHHWSGPAARSGALPANPVLKPARCRPRRRSTLATEAVRLSGSRSWWYTSRAKRRNVPPTRHRRLRPAVGGGGPMRRYDRAPLVWPDAPGNVAGSAHHGDRSVRPRVCGREARHAPHRRQPALRRSRSNRVAVWPSSTPPAGV